MRAVDTRHLPLYRFRCKCPRATFWATSGTGDADVEAFLAGHRRRRVHVVEPEWTVAMRRLRVVAYRLIERHAYAGIELSIEDDLLALLARVSG